MSDLTKFQGIFPAFYACYDGEGEVCLERVRALVRYFIRKGVQGIYCNGSSGECIYQSVGERKAIIEAVMDEARGKLVVINHVACNNTRDSAELARHSQEVGVDAIASIPPIYFRLPEYAIAEYWNRISAAAPDTDFIIYNIPQLAGTSLTPSLFNEMLKNPRVIGVKNSSMPTQDIQIFKSRGIAERGAFVLFNGPDEQFVAGRAIGADGGIGGTYGVMPDLFLMLDRMIREGESEKAIALQYAINAIISQLCSTRASLYAVAKEVLRINENLDIGGVRPPLTNLTPDDLPASRKAAAMVNAVRGRFR